MGGLCGVSSKQNDDFQPRARAIANSGPNLVSVNKIEYSNQMDDKFKDFEEFNDGRTYGESIKQIPAYKCTLPYDALENLRKEFWENKRTRTWLVLKTCCEADACNFNFKILYLVSAQQFLNEEDLRCLGTNMRCIVCVSNPDIIYNIPNFCIVDPIFEKDFITPKNKEDKIIDKNITIFLNYVFNNEEYSFSVSHKIKGKELKELYSETAKKPLTKYRIRLLFKGQEINDNHSLFYHNIQSKDHIQVSIAEL